MTRRDFTKGLLAAAERSASWDIFVRDWADREIGFSLT